MIRLTRAPDMLMGQHWANLLQQAGIACHLTGQYLQGGAGDIPVFECGPNLWLENEADKDAALRIIEGRADEAWRQRAHWHCGHCNEWLEPQFSTCWQCGASRPVHPHD